MLAPTTAPPPEADSPAAASRGALVAPRPFTVAELAERFGSLPAWRVRTDPAPGTVTLRQAERLVEKGGRYELIDGTLVERAVSEETGFLDTELAGLIREWVKPRRIGWAIGPSGYVRLYGGDLLRAPDASFVRRDQRPDGLARRGYSEGAPALCVEVFSPDNTRPEMVRKRREYFENGCELTWTVYPRSRTVEVHTPATGPEEGAGAVLTDADRLDGAPVLPGLLIDLRALFDEADLPPLGGDG